MPTAAYTGHRWIDDMAVPYVTFGSPISNRAALVAGFNVMTSIRQVLERRPGFSGKLETNPTTFDGRISNIYTWRRWNGNFFVMLSITNAGASEVWKLEVGKDANFILLHTQQGSAEPFDYIARNNHCFFGNGRPDSMWKYDGIRKTRWGIKTPTIKPQCNIIGNGTSSITASVDYHFRYTYWNDFTGHESSPSEVNDCMGQFTDKAIQVSVFASPDPQVTHMRIYRTRDGGSVDPREMQEINQSPIANVSATVTDWTADADMRNRFAPALYRNDPPPPMRGFASHGSRIHGFSAQQEFYSGFDEVVNGVQEECFPGGQTGNFYPMDSEIGALAKMTGDNSGMVVFTPGNIVKIDGELRSEMRRYEIDEIHGARTPRAVFGLGSEVLWFDVSKQVRLSSVGELSSDIRTDLASMDAMQVSVCPHVSDTRNWICLLNTINGKMLVYDTDIHSWQVPWTINASAIYSGEIALGKRVLLAAINNQIWYMVEGTYNDHGIPYAAECRSNLISVAPDKNPDDVQGLDSVSVERNTTDLSDILVSLDELPTETAQYISVKANEGNPTHRVSSKKVVERRFTIPNEAGVARRMSFYLKWPAEDKNFEIYSMNVEVHPFEI